MLQFNGWVLVNGEIRIEQIARRGFDMRSTKPILDIYKGIFAQGQQWMESVHGLEGAQERMEQLAAEQPGDYFVFDPQDHRVLSTINPSPIR